MLLIGGTSHVGKSTLAARLADDLGWQHLSTDQLARHPGRPWRHDRHPVPDHVIAHYAGLGTEQLMQSVVAHYRENVWPIVEALVSCRRNNPFDDGLVLEGSAIMPDPAVSGGLKQHAVWLTGDDTLIRTRILTESRFEDRPELEQRLIQAFLDRALAFNRMLAAAVTRDGLRRIDAGASNAFDTLRSLTTPD